MSEVEFIGREREVSTVLDFCDSWKNQSDSAIFIEALGGLGKTRLLQHCHAKLTGGDYSRKLYALESIVDFDDAEYTFVSAIRDKIIADIETHYNDRESFDQYRTDWERFEEDRKGGGLSSRVLDERRQLWLTSWHDGIQDILSNRHLIVFLDTTDALTKNQRRRIDEELIIPSLGHICFVIAGRNSLSNRSSVSNWSSCVSLELLKFTTDECQSYLKKKCELVLITALDTDHEKDQSIRHKIITLSDSNLILIDLCIMIIRREQSLGFLDAIHDTMKSQAFKKIVMLAYLTEHEVHRIVLLLSYCYPMNPEMLSQFLYGRDSTEEIFDYLQGMAFVKILPNGFIRLHDVMREIIEGLSPDEGVSEAEKLEYSQKFTNFLRSEVEKNKVIKTNDAHLWLMKVEKMRHDIIVCRHDQKSPVSLVENLFDECEKSKQLGVEKRAFMMDVAERTLHDYTSFSWIFLRIKYYILKSEYSVAEDIALDGGYLLLTEGRNRKYQEESIKGCLAKGEYAKAKKISGWNDSSKPDDDLYVLAIHLWKLAYDQGNFDLAINRLRNLEDLPEDNKESFRKHNLMGLTYQKLGEFSLAIQAHWKAFKKIMRIGPKGVSKVDLAHVHNALSRAYALNLDPKASQAANEEAMRLYEEDNNAYGIGQCLTTRALSRIEFNRPNSAIKHLQRALDYEGTMSFLERTRIELAFAHANLLLGKLDVAERHLKDVYLTDLQGSMLLGRYHQLFAFLCQKKASKIKHQVLSEKRWLDKSQSEYGEYRDLLHKAGSCFQRGLSSYQDMGCHLDSIFLQSSLIETKVDELITLTTGPEDCQIKKDLIKTILNAKAWLENLLQEKPDYAEKWSVPLLWKSFADYHLVSREEALALEYYQKSLSLIAKNRMYEPFSIKGQLKKTEDYSLTYLYHQDNSENYIHAFASKLNDFWENQHPYEFPEASQIFANWSSGSYKEWGGQSGPLF